MPDKSSCTGKAKRNDLVSDGRCICKSVKQTCSRRSRRGKCERATRASRSGSTRFKAARHNKVVDLDRERPGITNSGGVAKAVLFAFAGRMMFSAVCWRTRESLRLFLVVSYMSFPN